MKIIKYNATKGEAAAKAGASSASGSDYAQAITDLSDSTAKNSAAISDINAVLSGLDTKYIKHGGDDDAAQYEFGRIVSDDIYAVNYFTNGMGFRAVFGEQGYEINVRDIGDTTMPLATTTGVNTELVGDTQLSVTLSHAFSLQNNQLGARVMFKAGLSNTPSNVTIIEEQAYVERIRGMRSAPGQTWIPLYKDGDEWMIGLPNDGNLYDYNIYYECTVRYTGQLSVYSAAQIRGSISDGVTRYYGGGYSLATMKADSIMVEDGTNAIKVTATGIMKTTDGGQTWVPY